MTRRSLKTRSLPIPLGAFVLVALATWSPVCSVAHLIDYIISSFPVLWKIILFSKLLNLCLEWKSLIYLRQCIWHEAKMSLRFLFSSRPCPKGCRFFFLLKTTDGPSGYGRAEVVLNGKWFCFILFLFSEDLLFSKMGKGRKASLGKLLLLLNFSCNSAPLWGHSYSKVRGQLHSIVRCWCLC